MSENKKIAMLIVLLAIVFGLIGALVSYDLKQYDMKIENVLNGEDNLIEVSQSNEIKNNNVLVTDKFTGKLEKDAKVIAVGSDGSMYIVTEGTILVSDMVIKNTQETTSVYRVNEPAKFVSTN